MSAFDLGGFAVDVEELTGFAADILTEEQMNNRHFAHMLDEAVPVNEQDRFKRKPRRQASGESGGGAIDRDPALADELRSLLAACEEIASLGRERFFDVTHELSYFAAEAVIIHFYDLVTHRLREHVTSNHPDFPWRGIAGTRNILAHKYTRANRQVVWIAVSEELPILLGEVLASLERKRT